jgi:hypothetical protein
MNSEGNDTITGNLIPVTTDSDGVYTFELKNLKSGYRDGDEILITAEKEGIIGSNSIIISEGSWGSRADISLGIKETSAKEPLYASFCNNWILMMLLIVIIAVIFTALLLKRRKRTKPNTEHNIGPLLGEEVKNKETEEEHLIYNAESEGAVGYECPECSVEINVEDTRCSNCGVGFVEMEV